MIRQLAQQLLEQHARSEAKQAPIVISLRKFQYDDFNLHSLQHYLRSHESDEIAATVTENLEAGSFRFFFDGLDEILLERRDTVFRGIQGFLDRYPRNSLTITARDAVFQTIPKEAELYRLGDWDDFLIKRWCYENLRSEKEWKQFYSNVTQATSNRSIFRNPLMLNLAAYLYEQYNMLPHRRVDLLFNVLNAIVDEWDKARGIRRSTGLWHSPRHKLSMLALIAYRQLTSENFTIDEATVQKWAGERSSELFPDICRALAVETGLLTEQNPGNWSFAHRSIQEYLAAAFIADSSTRAQELLDNLDREQRKRLIPYLSNMVSDNNSFIEQLLSQKNTPEHDKGEILATALADGMEISSAQKAKAYDAVGIYMNAMFEIASNVEVAGKRASIFAKKPDTTHTIVEFLYLVARLGRTKFGEELRDIAKAIAPRTIVMMIEFVLNSSAFFVTKVAKDGKIEARNEMHSDFDEK